MILWKSNTEIILVTSQWSRLCLMVSLLSSLLISQLKTVSVSFLRRGAARFSGYRVFKSLLLLSTTHNVTMLDVHLSLYVKCATAEQVRGQIQSAGSGPGVVSLVSCYISICSVYITCFARYRAMSNMGTMWSITAHSIECKYLMKVDGVLRYLCNVILLHIVYLMSVCFNMNLFLHDQSLCECSRSVGPGEIQKLAAAELMAVWVNRWWELGR